MILKRLSRDKAVLYLDLDGTVRHGKDELGRFVNGPADVTVFPEAVVLMRRWHERGGRVVAVSNQGGIGLGIVDAEEVAAAMAETQRQTGHLLDLVRWCPHHPGAADPAMARCWCRKPAPGLLIQAATELAERHGEFYPLHLALMVGDRPEDERCAATCGMDFMWAKDWRLLADLPEQLMAEDSRG